jgi:hypothetical protein
VGLGLARELEKRADAPPKARPAPPPPAPALPTTDFYGRAVFSTFIASLVALLFVVLKVEEVFPHDAQLTVRIVLTVVLSVGALLQLTNWRQANQRLAQRLLSRTWGPRGAMNRREKAYARICRDLLTIAGIVWLAAAVFELLVLVGVSDATVVG